MYKSNWHFCPKKQWINHINAATQVTRAESEVSFIAMK